MSIYNTVNIGINMLKISVLCASVVMLVSLSACDGIEARRSSYLAKGNAFLNANKLDKAKVEFKNVLQIDPRSVDGNFAMAKLNEKLKQHRNALAGYNKVIELQPDNKAALAAIGRLYLMGNVSDKAMEYAEKSLTQDAQYTDALVVRAGAYFRQSNIELALKDLRSALNVDPDHLASLALLSRIYLTQDQSEKSVALLNNALQRNLDSVELLTLLVQLHSDRKDYASAITEIQKLVTIDAENFSYRTSLAYYYDLSGNKEQAESVLRKAVADLPESVEAKRTLIQYLVKTRDLMFAQLELSRFIQSDSNNPELQLISAMLYSQSNENAKAEKIYRKMVHKYDSEPSAVKAQFELVKLLLADDKRETARDDAKKELGILLEANPKYVDGLILRGMLALEDKDFKIAIADFRTVLNDQPESVRLIKLLSNAYLQAG